MDQKEIVKTMISLNKTAFQNTYNSIKIVQEQAENMAQVLLEQSAGMPEEAKKALKDWIDAFKNGREEFKVNVEKQFDKLESYLNELNF